jgi:hypothetical protein
VLCSNTEEGVDELTLADDIALFQPTDLSLSDCMHRLIALDSSRRAFGRPEPVNRTRGKVVAAAPYATPVIDGRRFFGRVGVRSRMWMMLYAQVTQADGAAMRNVLLLHKPAPPVFPSLT